MMKNVAIATDSHSSITPEMAQTLGVAVLPMPFTIDGTCYLEEETLTRAEFYAHQRRGAKIATSQSAPADVTALWDNLLTDHDEVVYIPISSGLSGSCQAAMALAAEQVIPPAQFILVDGNPVRGLPLPSQNIVKGDARSASIAAASILAKTHRDHRMVHAAGQYPGYGFEIHKGYGTELHLNALRTLGATPLHRKTFAPVRDLLFPPEFTQQDLF